MKLMLVVVIGLLTSAAISASAMGQTTTGRLETRRDMKPIPIGSAGDWFSPADYPPAALRSSRTGRAVVVVGVDSAGAVVTCRVETSSGTDLLDQRTCELAKIKGRFNPATDRKGRPTAGEFRLNVKWAIPGQDDGLVRDLGQIEATDEVVVTETTYAPDGTMMTCRLVSMTGLDVSDPCKTAKIGQKTGVRWQRNGEAVAARLVQHVTLHVEPLP